MPLTATASFADGVASNAKVRDTKVTIDLPGLTGLDVSLNVAADTWSCEDNSSYPPELAPLVGDTDFGGTITLADTSGSGAILQLLNPDDSRSAVFGKDLTDSRIELWYALATIGQQPDLMRRAVTYLKDFKVDVTGGTATIDHSDVPSYFDKPPTGADAVLTAPPYNAGLTSEFVIDRVCRIVSGGVFSSWPAQRANCLLAVSGRSSLAPELGDIDTTYAQQAPLFGTGKFGTAYVGLGTANPGVSTNFDLSTAISGTTVTVEGWVDFGNIVGAGDQFLLHVGSDLNRTAEGLLLQRTSTGVQVGVISGGTRQFAPTITTSLGSSVHYVLVTWSWAKGSTSWSATVTIDGTTTTTATQTANAARGSNLPYATLIMPSDSSGSIEGWYVTTEATPVSNNGFVPLLVCDPSLNPLQAVPAIAAGTTAWAELQTIAEAEAGWIGMIDGVLTFKNRDTIRNNTVLTAVKLLPGLTGAMGNTQQYDDIAITYTDYAFSQNPDGTVKGVPVFTPGVPWRVPARDSRSWIIDLPNGVTVASVDGSITYETGDPSNPGSTRSVLRASLDRYGQKEVPNTTLVYGTVTARTSSRIEITVVNNCRHDVWLVSPATYLNYGVGDPALWINGVTVTPSKPVILHCNDGTPVSTYPVPDNAYRQDRDATEALGWFFRKQLRTPKVTYENANIDPDPRLLVTDVLSVPVPLQGGGTDNVPAYLWAVQYSADYTPGSETSDMSVTVRAAIPPRAWRLGVHGASELGVTTRLY